MNRKTTAIILEAIPVIAASLSFILLATPLDTGKGVAAVAFLLAFSGFAFAIIGRLFAKGDRAVRILGILDCIATAFIIGIYVLAIFAFGL